MPSKEKSGTYKGRVRIKGHPQKIKTGFKTWNEAKAWELRTAETLKNPPQEDQRFTFFQVAELWLKNCLKRRKVKTCEGKAVIIDRAIEYWRHDPYIDDLSALMIEDFLNSLPGKTANRYKRELGTLFIFAVKRGIAVENLAGKVERYKEKKFKRYVPPAEDIETVKAFADSLELDIITIAYNTLARAGEIRNLTWDDVDLKKKEITLWTGKRDDQDRQDDTLEMTETLYKFLLEKSKKKTHKKWVLTFEGKKIEAWWINEVMRRIYKKAKIAGVEYKYFSLHCIRHHVAALLTYKLSLLEISKILRHRRVSTTDIYLRSLVTIKTKGIGVLDDFQKEEKADVISFQDAVNKRQN